MAITLATFNLCNLGAEAPPSRLAQVGTLIAQDLGAPTILAVQEIMVPTSPTTTGPVLGDAAYQALSTAIRAAGGPVYAFREIPPFAHHDGGMAGANVRVGLLFDATRVTLPERGVGRPQDRVSIHCPARRPYLIPNPGRIEPNHPAFVGDPRRHWAPCRKALAAELIVQDRRLFVIVCHFKSMRASTRRAEAYAKHQRQAQAEVVHRFAADLLACDPQAAIAILGDLNDVPGSRTLKLLKGEQFHNLLDDLPRHQCYTQRHGPVRQALDHILLSPVLRRGATVRIVHHSETQAGNAEPVSDHDPVVATVPFLDNS